MAIFSNRATLTYRGITSSSNTVVGELVGALTADKTALSESYAYGTSITYVLSLINSGDTEITGVTVTDDLGGDENAPLDYADGSAALFVDGVRQSGLIVNTADGLAFSGITVPANGSSLLIYTAEVNGFAPLAAGSCITNTAEVTYGTSSVSASYEIPVSEGPVLSVTKSLSPLTVTDGGSVTYTFLIENSGNMAAELEDGTTLDDVFDPALTGLSANLNGTPLVPITDYTYDEATGEFSTVPGVITVPAATYSASAGGEITVVPGTCTLTVTGIIEGA